MSKTISNKRMNMICKREDILVRAIEFLPQNVNRIPRWKDSDEFISSEKYLVILKDLDTFDHVPVKNITHFMVNAIQDIVCKKFTSWSAVARYTETNTTSREIPYLWLQLVNLLEEFEILLHSKTIFSEDYFDKPYTMQAIVRYNQYY